jgi:hypothetical protein
MRGSGAESVQEIQDFKDVRLVHERETEFQPPPPQDGDAVGIMDAFVDVMDQRYSAHRRMFSVTRDFFLRGMLPSALQALDDAMWQECAPQHISYGVGGTCGSVSSPSVKRINR